MTLAVCVTFQVHEANIDEFKALLQENARISLEKEPGCTRFDICSDSDRPFEIFLYELYDSPDGFGKHLQSEHFLSFDEAVSTMIRSKSVATYRLVN